jgi:predicted DNA-binding protein (MmcQ/YjbR family)
MAFPGATETVQWGNDLVFKVGGKMFAVAPLEPSGVCVSFKCSDEDYALLVEKPGIIPAPYLARAKWVGLEDPEAIPAKELQQYLAQAYELVKAKLPAAVRRTIDKPATAKKPRSARAGSAPRSSSNRP